MQTDFALTMTITINAENILKGALAKSWVDDSTRKKTKLHTNMFYSLWRSSLSSPVKVFFAILCLCSVIFWGLGLGKLIIFWSFGDNEKITEVCKLEKSGFFVKNLVWRKKWWMRPNDDFVWTECWFQSLNLSLSLFLNSFKQFSSQLRKVRLS